MKDYIIRKIINRNNDNYSYHYFDKRENKLNDKNYIKICIEGLYIPPAYDNVKINLKKNGKVRAIGYDDEKRSLHAALLDWHIQSQYRTRDWASDFR